jgi:hypothetical protein
MLKGLTSEEVSYMSVEIRDDDRAARKSARMLAKETAATAYNFVLMAAEGFFRRWRRC